MAACTTPPTQLVVHVDTDLEVGPEIDGFDVRVWGPSDRLVLERDYELVGPAAITLPASFGVAPRDGDPDRSVRIAVRASRPNAAGGILEARARTGYVEHEMLRLDLYLARACIGVECRDGTTCRAGGCVPELIDPETLPHEGDDAAVPDAAVSDAAPPDAGPERATVTTVFALRGSRASIQNAKIALDPDGTTAVAAIVAGEVDVDGARMDVDGTWGTLVVRLDADGAVLWSHLLLPIDPASYVIASSVEAAPDGHVIVAGTCRGGISIDGLDFPTNDPTDTPALGVVFEADGSLAPGSPTLETWNAGTLEPIGLDVTPAGERFLTGQFIGTIDLGAGAQLVDPTGSGSFLTARYDADGTFVQACTMAGGIGVAVEGLADGGLVAIGQFAGTSDHGLESHGFFDAFAIRFGSDCHAAGEPVFAHAVGGTGLDQLFDVTVDDAGRTLAVGRYGELDVAIDDGAPLALERLQDALLVAFERDGAMAFWREIGGDGIDFLTAIEAAADGDLWMAGEGGAFEVDGVSVHNAGGSDAIVLGASPDGVVQWARSFGGPGPDVATDLAADPLTGELVLTGWATAPATLGDTELPADAPLAIFVLRVLP